MLVPGDVLVLTGIRRSYSRAAPASLEDHYGTAQDLVGPCLQCGFGALDSHVEFDSLSVFRGSVHEFFNSGKTKHKYTNTKIENNSNQHCTSPCVIVVSADSSTGESTHQG